MTYFSVVQIDMHPAPYVAATGSARSAQILARLVAERCPGNVFGIRDTADFKGPKSNGFIRDCALSVEVQTLAAQELMAEADDNPRPASQVARLFLRQRRGRKPLHRQRLSRS